MRILPTQKAKIPDWAIEILIYSLMSDDVDLQKMAQETIRDMLVSRLFITASPGAIDSILRQEQMISAQAKLLFSDDLDVVNLAAQVLLVTETTNPRIHGRMRELLSATRSDVTMAVAYHLWMVDKEPNPAASRLREALSGNGTPGYAGMLPDWLLNNADSLRYRELKVHIAALDSLLSIDQSIQNKDVRYFGRLRQARGRLVAEKETRYLARFAANWKALAPAAYLLAMIVFWNALLHVRPLWIHRLSGFVASNLTFTLPQWLGGFTFPVQTITLLSFYRHHDRVLDAWVLARAATVRSRFNRRPSVKSRLAYVSVPARLNDEMIERVDVAALRAVFERRKFCLLITGEGGSGKSSIAFQIAQWGLSDRRADWAGRHPIVPVLIEEELPATEGNDALLAAISTQLQDLTEGQQPVSDEFLEVLLRRQRILLIADHFSEMREETKQIVRPDQSGFPANALVVTSRRDEELGVDCAVLKPSRIRGNRLSSFVEAYLTLIRKRDLFTDQQFFRICAGLSELVGERDVTPLLATLYARLVIAAVEESTDLDIPRSIPQLMIEYVNLLNRVIERTPHSDRAVQHDAKAVAWAVTERALVPSDVSRGTVLEQLGGDDAEGRLDYLESALHLVQTIGPTRDRVRFTIDPLAEYLAAIFFIEARAADKSEWGKMLDRLQQDAGTVRGFATALIECSREPRYGELIPAESEKALADLRARLNPDAEAPIRHTRRAEAILRVVEAMDLVLPQGTRISIGTLPVYADEVVNGLRQFARQLASGDEIASPPPGVPPDPAV